MEGMPTKIYKDKRLSQAYTTGYAVCEKNFLEKEQPKELDELKKLKSDETRFLASREYWYGKYDGFTWGLAIGIIYALIFCSIFLMWFIWVIK